MADSLIVALISVSLFIGFCLGVIQQRRKKAGQAPSLHPWPQKRYYEGLTQLLNDEPDAAIDTFIGALEVNSDTLETHLALGSLLRKRGEISRAIRIHQNLLSRPSLSLYQMRAAQLELALDYMRAGLLDRAESLLKELIDLRDIDKNTRTQAMTYLLEVYQDLREWLQAIDVADRLTVKKFGGAADMWRQKQAQFSCEIAEAAIEEGDWLTARRLLHSAARYDKNCARSSLLSAHMEMALGDYGQALVALRKVSQQDDRFTAEALAPMFECYKKTDNLETLLKQLTKRYDSTPELAVLRYLAKTTEAVAGGEAALELLMRELPRYPEMEPAGQLLKLVSDERGPLSLRNYAQVKGVLEKLTEARQHYLCGSCGFEGSQLYWLCPSCKSWSTVALVPAEAR